MSDRQDKSDDLMGLPKRQQGWLHLAQRGLLRGAGGDGITGFGGRVRFTGIIFFMLFYLHFFVLLFIVLMYYSYI